MVWPSSVERLDLDNSDYDKPLGGIGKWLPNLRELSLFFDPKEYKHCLKDLTWPAGLRKMNISESAWKDHLALLPEGVVLA